MIVSIILIAALALALIALRTARGHAARVETLEQLQGLTRPLDLPAFLNLVDPAEQEFLRMQLPPPLFRQIQRRRLRASVCYLVSVAANAAVLVQAGEALSRDTVPEIARRGDELMNAAIRLRAFTFLALALVYARMAFPGAHFYLLDVPSLYERVLDRLGYLARLKHPAHASRILQAL
jgi:hypothetical protein